MRVGFVTQTHTGDVGYAEAVAQAAAFGFEYVELYMDGATERTRFDHDRFVSLLDDRGLDLLVHLPFLDLDLGTPREAVRRGALDELRACVRDAAEMGAEKAVLHPYSNATPPEYRPAEVHPIIVDSVAELDGFARDLDVELCAENLPGVQLSIHDFDRLFDGTEASMTLDTGHARVDGLDESEIAAFLDSHLDRVSHLHLNETRGPRDEHLPFGSGTLDFEAVLAPLLDADWDGTASIEAYTFDADYLELSKRKLDALLA
ncbi:sugar phosphate isomerase/epimerase family protein [Halegenticoccus tardaugens]|uniref:sugar phosphate isomerase/epimerase family protein n=1 Tax=Halegenticoccus tardaugens TaxID=2071624 RepID=UPI00100B25F5|nr:sugar phosphate isomerase/epimerase family protein [Halegenticoccus tardaugens]